MRALAKQHRPQPAVVRVVNDDRTSQLGLISHDGGARQTLTCRACSAVATSGEPGLLITIVYVLTVVR